VAGLASARLDPLNHACVWSKGALCVAGTPFDELQELSAFIRSSARSVALESGALSLTSRFSAALSAQRSVKDRNIGLHGGPLIG
jgi:hypothetical protein